MTDNEFNQGLTGEIDRTKDGSRLCYKVADGLTEYAKELRKEGRKDKASRVAILAGKLRGRVRPTKAILRSASAEIEVIRKRMVDGIDEAVWD